jgi:hypothetical protein
VRGIEGFRVITGIRRIFFVLSSCICVLDLYGRDHNIPAQAVAEVFSRLKSSICSGILGMMRQEKWEIL